MQAKSLNLARDNFNDEIDLKNILQLLRMSKFLVKVNMNMQQRRAVNFSRKFIIGKEKVEKKNQKEKTESDRKKTFDSALIAMEEQLRVKKEEDALNKLVSQLNPRDSIIDRRLLFELTGMAVDIDDNYQADETDPFEDDGFFADFDSRWF